MAPDLLRSVPCQQPNDESADDRDGERPESGPARGGGDETRGESMEVSQVREEADQPDQRQRDEGTDHADQRRHHAECDETRVGGIVAELVVELGVSRHGRDTAM